MTSAGSPTQPVRFESAKPMLIAGYGKRITMANMRSIPELWQQFGPLIGRLPGQIGRVAYGICSNMTPDPWGMDYLAGVEVSSLDGLPQGLSHVSVLAARYAVFSHREHATKISETVSQIYRWLPQSGYVPAGGSRDIPAFIERYGEGFDPVAGKGDTEVWMPVRPASPTPDH
jgi:AraC family transcriptional regulator